jgi:hypothetical protein
MEWWLWIPIVAVAAGGLILAQVRRRRGHVVVVRDARSGGQRR